MFNHAIRHPDKKALTDIRNNEGLTPLALAAKLGRKELFLQCLELSNVVEYRIEENRCLIQSNIFIVGNLEIFEYQMLYISITWN